MEKLNTTNNTIDKIVKECSFIKLENRIYNVNVDIEFDKYVYVNKNFIEKVLKLDKNEMSVYIYLYYRIGIKDEIKTSIMSIKNNCLISEKTITNTISKLEKNETIKVLRSKYNYKTDNKESNTYKLVR